MPAYDYKCQKCSTVVEKFFKYPPPDEIPCEEAYDCQCSGLCDCETGACEGTCEYFPTFYYNSPAQRFEPVVVHRAEDGTYRFPGRADAAVPEGFQKVELTDFHQIRKFEREIESIQSLEASKWRDTRQKYLDGQLAANREGVAAIAAGGAWQGLDERGQIITRHGLTPQGLRFYERMREASERRQKEGPKATRPAFYLDAFANNASNREAYYKDAPNGFMKGRK